MKADAVFIHQRFPRVALQVAGNDFFAIQTKYRNDIGIADQITGDLAMHKVKYFFNITRGTLIQVKVLGRFATLNSAIGATSTQVYG